MKSGLSAISRIGAIFHICEMSSVCSVLCDKYVFYCHSCHVCLLSFMSYCMFYSEAIALWQCFESKTNFLNWVIKYFVLYHPKNLTAFCLCRGRLGLNTYSALQRHKTITTFWSDMKILTLFPDVVIKSCLCRLALLSEVREYTKGME